MGSLNSEQKKAIKSTILECRDILEKDIEQVLINYGIYINKDWVNLRDLKNLTEEQENNRKNIEKAIEKLEKGGFKRDKAVIEYIKEVSYTYLNRLAALRVMEVRGLIDEILVPRVEYGNKSFINSRFYEVAREFCKYEIDAGLGYLLNIMFDEISEEIKILFNTEDEYSFVTPSSTSLLKVIELLCSNIDEESWKQDEIIGWIYQYFNDKEKDDVFDRLYNKKQKIKVEDIPAATQLFTPDWIVDWIVDNSLGSLWDEIKQGKREYKKVEDIKLLDPCCGSGHFLVKAFDLFYEMYVEEGIYTKEEIPYKILENNIYGIDIDLRAVQLTGLILFIKVKSSLKENGYDTNTKGKLSVNLVCADSILLNGNRLADLKEKHRNNKTILKMIEIIYEEFEDVRLKGSLIQPEKKLFPLFEEFKNRTVKKELSKAKRTKKKQTKGQENLFEEHILSFSEYKSQRDFTKEERELMSSLDAIYSEAIKANDISRQLFANEAKKSVKLVDIFMKQYDVVVTNPPYMGKKNMNKQLINYLKKNYKNNDEDLYSVFIERCMELASDSSKVYMITQSSYMFLTSFVELRKKIIDSFNIEHIVYLGTRAFDDISGEKVNTAILGLEKGTDIEKSKCYKLDKFKTSRSKRDMLWEIEKVPEFYLDKYYFEVTKSDFKKIEGYPYLFWISDKVRNIFLNETPLKELCEPKIGFQTGEDKKLTKYFWEVKNKNNWITYFKAQKLDEYTDTYYNFSAIVLKWDKETKQYLSTSKKARKNYLSKYFSEGDLTYAFKRAITYSYWGSSRFKARLLPENVLFDVAGSSIFINNDTDIYYYLGLLNSEVANYFLTTLNPTFNFQKGDLDRVPIVIPNTEIKANVEDLVKKNIKLREQLLRTNELNPNFEKPLLLKFKKDNLEKTIQNTIKNENEVIKELVNNQMRIDQLLCETYGLDLGNLDIDYEEMYHKEIEYLRQNNLDNIESLKIILEDGIKIPSENNKILTKYYSVDELQYILGEPIDKIVDYVIQNNIITNEKLMIEIKKLISYFVGVIFGRWDNKYIPPMEDGICAIDSSIYLEKDMVEKIYECMVFEFGEENSDKIMENIEYLMKNSFDNYLIHEFFNEHIKHYQKRPIYWHICSPKKTFNCFVYYHKLDNDTLYKVKSIYLSQMIDRYEEDLKYYTSQLIEARTKGDKSKEKDFKDRCSDLEAKLEDLNILDKKIMEILPYKPNIDEGVLYNIIPLEPILSAPVATKSERDKYYEEVGK